MPTLQLAGGRTFHLTDTLLDRSAAHVVHYQCALAPETSAEAAFEVRFQRQLPKPAAADALGQLTREARLAVFTASPQARALTILVEQVAQVPVTDFSDRGLRERLSYLLACGLTEARVQAQHARVEAELRGLMAPYVTTPLPLAEAHALEAARAQQRRVLALCDVIAGEPAPALSTRTAVAHAVLDLLEPAVVEGETSSIHPQVRQRSFDALSLLLLQAQRSGRIALLPAPWAKKHNPYLLPLGVFLAHVQASTHDFPA